MKTSDTISEKMLTQCTWK